MNMESESGRAKEGGAAKGQAPHPEKLETSPAIATILWQWQAVLSAAVIICALLVLALPQLRGVIIHFAETHIVHRALTHSRWQARFVKWAVKTIIIVSVPLAFTSVLRIAYRFIPFAPSNDGLSLIEFPRERFKRDWKILAAIFCALFSLRVYYLSQKEGLHVDEGLSVMISNYGEYWWGRDYDDGSTYTGKEIKKMQFCDKLSLKDTPDTLFRIWRYNRDGACPDFYYFILRLFLTGMKEGNVKNIVHHAGALSLVLFTLSFFFAYMLLAFLFDFLTAQAKERGILFFTLAIMFLTTGSISNAVFFRPYQLQECTALLFANVIARVFCALQSGKDKKLITTKNLIVISVVSSLFLISAYPSILLFAVAGLSLVIISLHKKRQDAPAFLCLAAFCTFALTSCLYPNYFKGIFAGMDWTATEHTKVSLLSSFVTSPLAFIAVQCQSHLFYIPVMIISIAALLLPLHNTASSGGGG